MSAKHGLSIVDTSNISTTSTGAVFACCFTPDAALNKPDCIRAPTLAGVLDSTTSFGKNQYKAIEFRSYFDSALNLRIECAHRWPLQAIPYEMRNWGDISVRPVMAYNQIMARDCPKGWQPIASATQALYSQKMYVQACKPCPAGTFSPAMNAACLNCPPGTKSYKGAVGIQACFCPAQKYLPYKDYNGEPDQLRCEKCPSGGICDGFGYPVPDEDHWFYESGSSIHECPFGDTCKGFEDSYSDASSDMCSGSQSTCILTTRDKYAKLVEKVRTLEERANYQCQEGYSGVLCAVCVDDWQLTKTGCQECGGSPSKVLATWIGLILLALIVGSAGIYAVKKYVESTSDANGNQTSKAGQQECSIQDRHAGKQGLGQHSQGAMVINTLHTYQLNQDLQQASDLQQHSNRSNSYSGAESGVDEETDASSGNTEESDDIDEDDIVGEELEEGAETEQEDIEADGEDPFEQLSGQFKILTAHLQVIHLVSIRSLRRLCIR